MAENKNDRQWVSLYDMTIKQSFALSICTFKNKERFIRRLAPRTRGGLCVSRLEATHRHPHHPLSRNSIGS